MNEKLRKQIKEYGDAGPYIIKAKAESLGLPNNWDTIPSFGNYAASSVLSYRGNDIWIFKFDPRWGVGEEYDMTHFKDYKTHPQLEELAWNVIRSEGGIERLPDEINLN